MIHRVFRLILVGALLSVPATAQPPWQPSRTPDGQPDLQGIWENSTLFTVVAALSLEGDHSRWQADFVIQEIPKPDAPPPSYIVEPPDGKIPYQPWALVKREAFIANMMAPITLEHIDPHARAFLDGVPRNNHVPGRLQILQVPGYMLVLYESNHAYRIIPLDGRPHIGENLRLFNGDSRGRWEGNTLVVDVTNQNDRTWLDYLSFHGEGLHVTERWTPVGPDRIDYRATLTDPTMFTQPWTIAYSFNRHKTEGFEIWEDARHEGERDVDHLLRGGNGR